MTVARYRFYDPRGALGRITLGAALGVTTAFLLHVWFSWTVGVLSGWNAAGLAICMLAWRTIARCGPGRTAALAASEDPGRTFVYVIVVLTSAASLLAATVLSSQVRSHDDSLVLLGLCVGTVLVSWLLTHTAFTLRYAHLYYREDAEGVGGIDFPGYGVGEHGAKEGRPSYSDFAYLAFTVGMCFQVSDTTLTSRQIRRAVLLHAGLSFFYNTAILAFVLNLVFGRAT